MRSSADLVDDRSTPLDSTRTRSGIAVLSRFEVTVTGDSERDCRLTRLESEGCVDDHAESVGEIDDGLGVLEDARDMSEAHRARCKVGIMKSATFGNYSSSYLWRNALLALLLQSHIIGLARLPSRISAYMSNYIPP